MIISFTAHFNARLKKFPREIREKFYKQADLLLHNLRHPSLRAKKYDETHGIWQARVDKHIRFYFLIEGDAYILLNITKHPQ